MVSKFLKDSFYFQRSFKYGTKRSTKANGILKEKRGGDIERSWNIRAEGKLIIVAVIDSGIHYEHPDFQQNGSSKIFEVMKN